MLFTTALCANVCGETIVNILGLVVASITACIVRVERSEPITCLAKARI